MPRRSASNLSWSSAGTAVWGVVGEPAIGRRNRIATRGGGAARPGRPLANPC